MAVFLNKQTQHRVVMRPMHAFGRYAAACQTVMRAADVSQIHARVRWDSGRWEILDQSRNGTSLQGRRLASGVWTVLEPGSVIRMGADDETVWTVLDLAPPQTGLFALDGSLEPIPLKPQGRLLPDDKQPVAEIHCRDGHWLVEYPEGIDHLVDGATVCINDVNWEFVLCPVLQETVESRLHEAPKVAPQEIALHFEVSLNEEHTELRVHHAGNVLDLGERIHHYTLLTLARKRLEDVQRGLEPHAQGWLSLDQLARMLGVEPAYINIQLFRAKHQVVGALPEGTPLSPLFERRRGEVRFGENAFSIRRGAALEGGVARGALMPSASA